MYKPNPVRKSHKSVFKGYIIVRLLRTNFTKVGGKPPTKTVRSCIFP